MKRYQLGLYEKAVPGGLGWDRRLEVAKRAGFDAMELSVDETDERLSRLDWSAPERKALRDEAQNQGLPFSSICLSAHRRYPLGSADPATERRGLEIMQKALELAVELSIPVIQLAGYDVYYEKSTPDTIKRFGDNLARAVEMAASFGVLLGFETMETPFMDTVGKAMAYVNEVKSPYLHVYPDIGNLTNASLLYGEPVTDDLRRGAGHLIAAHIKETVPGKYREIPFGTGHVDFAAAIGAAWSLGVRRFVTELWYVGQPDWRRDIEFACRLARRHLDAQG
ncbi:L-ribulose-5-phosphate 3-epimerase [Bacillota bacterium Meth-B3]